MIVAAFILVLFAVFMYVVWDDLSALIESELDVIGAGDSPSEVRRDVRSPGGLTATLTAESVAGADDSFGDAA